MAHEKVYKIGTEALPRQIDELLVAERTDEVCWPAEAPDAIEAAGLSITLSADEDD